MEWEQQSQSAYGYDYSTSTQTRGASNGGMRRRNVQSQNLGSFSNNKTPLSPDKTMKRNLKKLDMFPKVERDLTVKTDSGGIMTIIAYFLILVIVAAELYNHRTINNRVIQHMTVDKSLGKKMRVDLNMTFPALHCDDVHIDIMDVAGDAHNDVHDTMTKIPLHLDGTRLTREEIRLEVNRAHEKDLEIREALDKSLKKDYCGPCYGAGVEGQCCNHCDDVIQCYKDKKWDHHGVQQLAEQCIREGRNKPKPLNDGEGCQIEGYMEFGRVNGNFHIAMGEGIERNGQHIHTFLPEELPKFNTSHIIHELRFGPVYGEEKKKGKKKSKNNEQTSLEGVTKIVKETNGVTGMFQYFIKIVPTSYKGKKIVQEIDPDYKFDNNKEPLLETNRYFVTERFNPLMELDDEHFDLASALFAEDDDDNIAAAAIGGKSGTSHDKHEHHYKQQAILPGIFFIYQVYPFSVEISKQESSLTHLFIRILATVGGVFTIVGWLDTMMHTKRQNNSIGKR